MWPIGDQICASGVMGWSVVEGEGICGSMDWWAFGRARVNGEGIGYKVVSFIQFIRGLDIGEFVCFDRHFGIGAI